MILFNSIFEKDVYIFPKEFFFPFRIFYQKILFYIFWSARRYIEEYYCSLVNRFKLVIHLEDNYNFLSQCYSNNCFSKSNSLFIIRKFKYITSINKNLSTLYSIPKSKFFLLRPLQLFIIDVHIMKIQIFYILERLINITEIRYMILLKQI